MAWIKIENEVMLHPKVVEAGNEAFGAWVRMVAWCNSELTDGAVPHAIAMQMAGSKRVLRRLVGVGMLEQRGKDFQIHDYLQYQTPASAVMSRAREISRKRSKAGKLGAEKRWGKRQQESQQESQKGVTNRNLTYQRYVSGCSQNQATNDGRIFDDPSKRGFLGGKKMAPNMANTVAGAMPNMAQPVETTSSEQKKSIDFESDAIRQFKSRIFSRLKNGFETAKKTEQEVAEENSRKQRAHEQEHDGKSYHNGDCNAKKETEVLRLAKRQTPFFVIAKKCPRIQEYIYNAENACELGGASRAAVEPACQSSSAVSVHAIEHARTDELSSKSHQASSTIAGGALPGLQSSELVTSGALRRSGLESSSEPSASPEACRREKAPAMGAETRLGTEAMHAPGPGAQSRLNRNFDSLGHSTERTLSLAAVEELCINHGLTPMSPRWATRAQAIAPFSPDEIRRAMITAWSECHTSRPNPGFVIAILERWRAEEAMPPRVPAPDSEWAKARAREAEQRRRETGQPRQPAAAPAPKPPPVAEPEPEITEEQREKNLKFMKELMKQLNSKKGF